MRINTNTAALNSYNQLNRTQNSLSKSLERLSSGKRINGAADDAAGLAISEKMNSQTRGLAQAQRNAQDGISMIQTAEGALKESHSILQRMRELTVQSNNDTNTDDDRKEIQQEIGQLTTELNEIADRTEFNTKKLINGNIGVKLNGSGTAEAAIEHGVNIDVSGADTGETFTFTLNEGGAGTEDTLELSNGSVSQTIELSDTTDSQSVVAKDTNLNFDKLGVKVNFGAEVNLADYDGSSNSIDSKTLITEGEKATLQIGANKNQKLDIGIKNMGADAIGTDATKTISSINVTGSDGYDFDTRLDIIDNAIGQVSSERSKLGAYQNRLDHTINNLSAAEENLTAAESRISDVDMAKEMMNMSKQQILSQAGTAMMAQANQLPQGVLQLLG